MEDKQNQKTVVAFIAGLLIGGLVVWIFAASSNNSAPEITTNTNTENTQDAESDDSDNTPVETKTETVVTQPQSDTGTFSVANQKAGSSVNLGSVSYSGTDGWIVVHDVTGNTLGWALGAARYSTGVGLMPKTVDLLRNTVAGKTYRVVFYSENGDRKFDTKTDKPIMTGGKMVSADFKAE